MKNPICPQCGFILPELQQARAGRAGRGKSKARTSEQARKAALARWDAAAAIADLAEKHQSELAAARAEHPNG